LKRFEKKNDWIFIFMASELPTFGLHPSVSDVFFSHLKKK
jgi:hypothetical protein